MSRMAFDWSLVNISALLIAFKRRDLCHNDRSGRTGVMAHAERQRSDALTRGERCRLAVKDDLAPPRCMPPHFNRSPLGRRRFRLERLERGFFGCEARREALRRGASDACQAVLSLVLRKNPSDIPLAEALERSG